MMQGSLHSSTPFSVQPDHSGSGMKTGVPSPGTFSQFHRSSETASAKRRLESRSGLHW